MQVEKPFIYDLSWTELENWLSAQGEPGFRTQQIWVGLYQILLADFREFTTLPKTFRNKLAASFDISAVNPIKTIYSDDRQTIKTLFKLGDGCLLETVLMLYDERRTVCISTQSGCGLGCIFCATGQMGLSRNLSSGEIVAQVLFFARELAKNRDRITNVVFMGMGEPFHNYDHVMKAVYLLNDPRGFGLGARRMTISTAGIVPKIKAFADEDLQVNLAISLHTVDTNLRSQLMPINRKHPVAKVLSACKYYVERTHRRITFEYALIEGVNDSVDDAHALADQIRGLLSHVNLIPLNPTREFDQRGSQADTARTFADVLESRQIPCTIRLRRGIEIGAGCGQLAAEA